MESPLSWESIRGELLDTLMGRAEAKPRSRISFLKHFESLRDPRVVGRSTHLLLDIIGITICAVICGADSWEQVETYAKDHYDFLKTLFVLPKGIPSHDTFNRVFRYLDAKAFGQCFADWINVISEKLHLKPIRWHAAIDGKTARHSFDFASPSSALHLLTAWASDNGFTLGQMAVDGKSNEITGIPKLLEILHLEGAIVTIDAIGCQKKIAEKVREKKADYIFAVKENHPHLYEDIKQLFEKHAENPGPASSYSRHEATSKGHGRKEIRTCIVLSDLKDIRDLAEWKDAKRVAMVLRQCWEGDKYSEEVRYFLGSYAGPAQEYLTYSRNHWGIENGQHYVLDVTFREDDNRTRKDHGPANLALIRRIALSLLHQEKSTKMTTPTKRLHACGNDDYLLTILGGLDDLSPANISKKSRRSL
jgi:predicted transposase YbfD/YdcC